MESAQLGRIRALKKAPPYKNAENYGLKKS